MEKENNNNLVIRPSSKLNKYTRDMIEKIKRGEVEGLCIDENNYINVSDPELRVKIHELAEQIRNKPNDIFDTTEYFNQEGLFRIKFVKSRELKTKSGYILVFNLIDDLQNPDVIIDKDKFWKAGLFESGMTYTYDDTLFDITDLLTLLHSGDECIIRLGKNYRGTKFYIRYIESDEHKIGLREEF